MDLSTFQPIFDWLALHPHLSGAVVFSIAAIESLVVIGILVPGVALMLGIGTLVGLGLLPVWSTLFWAAAGAVFGDGLGYWLGRHYDSQLRNLWPLTRYPDLIPKGERFFKRHGGKSIVFGRFVGPIRSIIPAVAGMMHMPPARFYLVNIISAIAWAPAVILPGAAFGASLGLASDVALRLAIVLLVLFFLIWFIAWSIKKLFGNDIARAGRRIFLVTNTLYRQWPVRTLISGVSIAVLMMSMIFLLFTLEETPKHYSLSPQSWQQTDWRVLPVYRDMQTQDMPLQILWQGEIPVIKTLLLADGWFEVDRLKLTNAIRWLTPKAKVNDLPLWQTRFNTRYESLMLMKPLQDDAPAQDSTHLLLRLWPVVTEHLGETHFWVGSLSSLGVKPWLGDVNVLQEQAGEPLQWQRFLQGLEGAADKLSFSWVLRDSSSPRSDRHVGDMLLITNKANN